MKFSIIFSVLISGLQLNAQDFILIDLNSPVGKFTIGDFDGDGDGDNDIFGIAFNGTQPSDIYLYKNDGGSPISFEEITLGASYGATGGIDAVDYDNDGDIDVLLSKGSSHDVYLLKNFGDATFQEFPVGISDAVDLSCLDYDGDEDLDILALDYISSNLSLYSNNGDQTYVKHDVITEAANIIRDIDSGDFDEDGDLDIVIGYRSPPSVTPDIVIFKNNGNNFFIPLELSSETFDRLTRVEIGDVDKDGKLDISAVGFNSFVTWKNSGNLNFSEQEIVLYTGSSPFGFLSIDLVDINGDDIPDPTMGDNNGPIVWYKNINVSPLSYEKLEVGGVAPCNFIQHADFDLDGDNDLLVSNGEMWVYENNVEQISSIKGETKSPQFRVFPNPAKDIINVQDLAPGLYSYELYDLQGKLLLAGQLSSGSINTSKLGEGSYLLTIIDGSTGVRIVAEVIKL